MKSKEKNALSHIVKEAMAKKKWNQLKLADASGVSQGNLSKFLTGETDKVGVKNIYNILHCLDLLCDPNDRQQEISVVTCPEDPKYADIYQDVRMIIEAGSDREDIIVALRSGIRGMLLMLGEESENTRMLKEIRDLLRNLLELRARSKMGRVNAAPEPGE